MNEKTSPDTPNQGAKKVKTYIAWLTGILLGIPALINAGVDVYYSIMNIPKGTVEALNEKKRSEHFQAEPLFSHELEIPHKNTKKILKLYIYQNADIYVNYSGYEQWLPVQESSSNLALLSFISSAHAGDFLSDFGSAKAVLPNNVINEVSSIEEIKRIKIDETNKLDNSIIREYWFEESSNGHGGFSPSSKTVNLTFTAIDGYKIVSHRIEIVSLNNATILSSSLSNDGKTISVDVQLRSGPIFDRWRGWVKAKVVTYQIKIE